MDGPDPAARIGTLGRKLLLAGLWVVGTLVAIAVAAQGVRIVDDRADAPDQALTPVTVTPEPTDPSTPAPPTSGVPWSSITSGPTPADGAPTTMDPASGPVGPAPAPLTPPDAAVPTTVVGPATSLPGGTGATLPEPTAPTAPRPPAATPTTTSAPTPRPPTPTTTVAAQVRTFELEGGSTAISFAPGQVTVVWATPHEGYAAEVKPNGSDRLTVEFRSDDHRSRIDAWWDDAPQHRIDED